jgi:protein-S-isoprenylcysteine O-methyltransferase Ste14
MKEYSGISIKIPPPVVTLIFCALMYFLDTIYTIKVVGIINNWLAAALLIVAFFLLLPAAIQFYKNKTTVNPFKPEKTKVLVVAGVYRYSRNPMYLGMALVVLAWAIVLGNPLNISVFFGFILYINYFQIKPEERALENIFGESFNQYKLSVRRWL